MSADKHFWGRSAAEDRVWAQVLGLRERDARRRLLAVWQAYMDESIDEGLFVLAGYIAPADVWAQFTREWEEILPYACRGPNGYRFKMSEMASLPERMARVPAFHRIIEKHQPVGLSIVLRIADFENAKSRLLIVQKGFAEAVLYGSLIENIYVFGLIKLMETFHKLKGYSVIGEFVPNGQKVDFIFDDRAEKKAILSDWDGFVDSFQHMKDGFGSTPRFESDDDFLPLQAADYLAWWVRKWGFEIKEPGTWWPWKSREMEWIKINMDEEEILADIMRNVSAQNPGDKYRFFDRKTLVTSFLPGRRGS